MTQQTLKSWKGYKPVALLNMLPNELSRQASLQFRSSEDDLDFLEESAFAGNRGTIFGLVSHIGAPVPGTELLAHEDDVAKGVPDLVGEALETLNLSRDSVRWMLSSEQESASKVVCLLWSGKPTKERTGIFWDELSSHGFEPVSLEPSDIEATSFEHLREAISRCAFVIIADAPTPLTLYELGIAQALKKPTWGVWCNKMVRLDEGKSIENLLQKPTKWWPYRRMSSGRLRKLVGDVVASFEKAPS